MDDKLYYVESPDEQVLGPMTMMHVLEGVAAGVILESARICEVGAQEWVYLSDVAYTREGESDSETAAAPAEDYFSHAEPEAADVPAAASEEPEPEPEPAAEDDLGVMHGSAWQPDPEPAFEQPEPAGETEPERPRATWIDETEPARPQPVEEPVEEVEPAAVAPAAYEAPFEENTPVSAAEPHDFDAPDELAEDVEQAEREYSRGKRRPKWLVPALAALALPAFAGAWLLTGRPIPFLASSGADVPPPPAEVSPLQQARELLVSGQAAEAQLRYEAILETEPQNAVAMHGHGMAAMAAGDHQTAVASLEKACTSEEARSAWTADLARALHAAGNTDSALQRLGSYLEQHPEDRDHQVARLDWLMEQDRRAEASKIYSGLAKDNPVNAYYQYLAGLALGEEAAAETYLRRSIELDPENGDAHSALGHWLAVKGDGAAARESLQRASERRPATPEDTALLAALDKAAAAAAPAPPTPEPKPTVTASVKKPAPKKPAPKPEEPKVVAAAEPKPAPRPDFSQFASRIRSELDRVRFESARGELEKARSAVGGGRDARNNAGLWDGIIAFEEGRFDDALARFEALDPQADYRPSGFGSGAVANWTARVWFAKGDVRKAVAALDGVGPADPDEYAVARLWEGVALATLGMDDLAARTWERI
ncbi:MAG TPA: tetratricopeptide repeat protein, partial [bacterium]|nr:tetratricopeptide repeat protein [bacterium]